MSKIRVIGVVAMASLAALTGNVHAARQPKAPRKNNRSVQEVSADTLSCPANLSDTLDLSSEFSDIHQEDEDNQQKIDEALLRLYRSDMQSFNKDKTKTDLVCAAYDRNINQLDTLTAYHLMSNQGASVLKMKNAPRVMILTLAKVLQTPEKLDYSQKNVIKECVRYIIQNDNPANVEIYGQLKIAALSVMNRLVKVMYYHDESYLLNKNVTVEDLKDSNSFFSAQFKNLLQDQQCREKFGEKPVRLKGGQSQDITSLMLVRYYLQYFAIQSYEKQLRDFYENKLQLNDVFYSYFKDKTRIYSGNRKEKKDALQRVSAFEKECFLAFGIDVSAKYFPYGYTYPQEEYEFLRKLEIENQQREQLLRQPIDSNHQEILLTAKSRKR